MKKVSLLMFAAIVATSVVFSSYGNEKESKRDPVPGKITITTSGGSRKVAFSLNQFRKDQLSISGIGGMATIDWGDGSAIDTVMFSEDGIKLSYEYSDTTAQTITITGTDLTSFATLCERYVTNLDVSEATGLVCLGIEGFLEGDVTKREIVLYNVNHQLKELDVTKNTALESLTVDGQLTELNVTQNTALVHLHVPNNKLAVLDVSKNTALKFLTVSKNQLTALDVTHNTALIQLAVNGNQLDDTALNALFGTLHPYPESLVGYRKTIDISENPGSNNCDQSIANGNGWRVQIGY